MIPMRLPLALVLLIALVLPAFAQRPGGEKIFPTPGYGITDVTDPVRVGKKAQRFEVRPGDCAGRDCPTDRERAMIRVSKKWRYGTPQWIGFSIFLPADFATSPRANTTIAMIHQRGGPRGKDEGYIDVPLLHLMLRGDEFLAEVHYLIGERNDVQDIPFPLRLGSVGGMRGQWTDVLLGFDTSGATQVLEVYLNGKRRIAVDDLLQLGIDQANLPVYHREVTVEDFIQHRPSSYEFQYGLLRSMVSRHGGPMPAQVMVFDEIRMGTRIDAALVDETKPVD
jgi:Polysaccharide lyase